jgi:hypothetical protein
MGVSCWTSKVKLNATQGQQFHIEWTTTAQTPSSLDFYITTLSAYNAVWYCDPGPQALYSSSGVKGSVDWSAPSAGHFVAVLVNNNPNSVSGILSIATSAITAVTSVSYATATTTNLVTTLQIVAASSSFISSWAIGVIVIVVLVVVLMFAVSRRRTKVEEKPHKVAEGVGFCGDCGAKLDGDSRFCKKCGTPVNSELQV